jgi:hypothetical protein
VVKRCSLWLALLLAAVTAAVWLHPAVPRAKATSWYYLALFTGGWAAFRLWQNAVIWRLSNPEALEATAKKLWDADRSRQRSAMTRLSLVLGARFGDPAFCFGRVHRARCNLWRDWWEQNHDRLVWNERLSVHIESEGPPDQAREE